MFSTKATTTPPVAAPRDARPDGALAAGRAAAGLHDRPPDAGHRKPARRPADCADAAADERRPGARRAGRFRHRRPACAGAAGALGRVAGRARAAVVGHLAAGTGARVFEAYREGGGIRAQPRPAAHDARRRCAMDRRVRSGAARLRRCGTVPETHRSFAAKRYDRLGRPKYAGAPNCCRWTSRAATPRQPASCRTSARRRAVLHRRHHSGDPPAASASASG